MKSNPQPDREYEMHRLLEDMDALDRARVWLFVAWSLTCYRARRLYLRLLWGKLADLMR